MHALEDPVSSSCTSQRCLQLTMPAFLLFDVFYSLLQLVSDSNGHLMDLIVDSSDGELSVVCQLSLPLRYSEVR